MECRGLLKQLDLEEKEAAWLEDRLARKTQASETDKEIIRLHRKLRRLGDQAEVVESLSTKVYCLRVALNVAVTAEVEQLIKQIFDAGRIAILNISHDMPQMASLADEAVVIRQGHHFDTLQRPGLDPNELVSILSWMCFHPKGGGGEHNDVLHGRLSTQSTVFIIILDISE